MHVKKCDLEAVQLNSRRRRLLGHGIALSVVMITGCRDGEISLPVGGDPAEPPAPAPSAPPATPPPPAAPQAWNPSVPPLLASTRSTFDLASTLPSSVPRGGKFGVDTIGAPLPAGMSLSAAGILAVGTAAIGAVTGVVFVYDLP